MDRKITTYFLKKIRNKERIHIQELDNHYLICDPYMLFKIKKDEFEINPALFTKPLKLEHIIPDEEGYKDAKLSCYRPVGERLFAELEGEGIITIVAMDIYKFFENCDFKIKSDVAPVLCYEKNGDLKGIAVPVRRVK